MLPLVTDLRGAHRRELPHRVSRSALWTPYVATREVPQSVLGAGVARYPHIRVFFLYGPPRRRVVAVNGCMDKFKPLPLHLSIRPFTMDEAKTAGISRSRSRRKDLWTPSRGIRVPQDAPLSLLESCRAHTAVTARGIVSHVSAATLHEFYLPQRLTQLPCIDVATPVGARQPRRKGVTGHLLSLGPHDVIHIGGVPATSVERTLVDIAQLLSVDELVAVSDQIICEHRRTFGRLVWPKVQLEALELYVLQHAGARGMRRLRAAMELTRVGSDSPRETMLRLMIARSPLPTFEHNVEIRDAAGQGKVGPDLACEEYMTCIEYDGGHHFTREQQVRDHDRDFVTASLGWHQVLINNDDIRAGELVVVTKIARMLKRGGWPDPTNLSGRSLQGRLMTRRDFQ